MKHLYAIFLSMILSSGLLWAQADESLLAMSDDAFYSMSLEELMSIRIVSVSKKSERLFDAPLSSYIISRQDMVNAGVNSIPEALKLCPGIIVREMTNGAYDFHIRGFDNPAEYSFTSSAYNLLTLVMIDNRPVFNQNNGGTFFESLPIDLNDVERIEVVRGPASALYGPNAVTGVINIITSRPEKRGVNVLANAQHGSLKSTMANASVGIKGNRFSLMVSGNMQQRDRNTTEYYEFSRDKRLDRSELRASMAYGSSFYLPISQTDVILIPLDTTSRPMDNPMENFPRPKMAVDKKGMNLFANYEVSSDISFDLSLGYSDHESQRAYFSNYTTMLTTNGNRSQYANLASKIFDGQLRLAYVNGVENMSYGQPGMVYDYHLFDMNFDYDIKLFDKLSFRPSFSMQEAVYDDSKSTIENEVIGMINGEASFINYAGSARLDFTPTDKLRLIAGFRTDKFNYPGDLYHSYQFSASYLFNPNLMLRSTYSRANSGSYIGVTYFNLSAQIPIYLFQPELPVFWKGTYNGNRNMKIFISDMFEMGWRVNLTDYLQIDMDIFSQGGKNMMGSIIQPQQTEFDPQTGLFTISKSRDIGNLDARIRMNGITFAASIALQKMMIKPFITYQQSRLLDFSRYPVHPAVDPVNNINSKVDKKHDTTPDYYGGVYFNYNPTKKLNLNLSPYFYGAQQHYHELDNVRETKIGEIPAKLQLNARIGYKVVKGTDLFISGKNMLNQQTREFYGTDDIGSMYFGGINFKL